VAMRTEASSRAVAFSAGGDGGGRSPEASRRNQHKSFAAASDCLPRSLFGGPVLPDPRGFFRSPATNADCTARAKPRKSEMMRWGIAAGGTETTQPETQSGSGELAAEPCSGAYREAIELYLSTPPERWRAPRAL
jgi:hypothetical protein